MKKTLNLIALAAAFALAVPAFAQPGAAKVTTATKATSDAKATAAKAKPAATAAPTDAEIADAKAKGLVWVNLDSKVYHKDGQWYGKTKKGKFMTVADADKAGYKAAKESPIGKKKTDKSTDKATKK